MTRFSFSDEDKFGKGKVDGRNDNYGLFTLNHDVQIETQSFYKCCQAKLVL